jgi:hypothetical protein
MSANTPHARLLNEAALTLLEPLGLWQVGRSRVWIDDRDWWLVVVEFQPGESSRGTYLNVGAMWLWHKKEHFSFDVGYRLEDFKSFRNKAQFEREALRLARRAAERVQKYRQAFASPQATAEYLVQRCDAKNPWSLYHAGVACGIAGRGADCGRCFEQFLEQARHGAWDGAVQHKSAQLALLAYSTDAFRAIVEEAVAATRAGLRLPSVDGRLFDHSA